MAVISERTALDAPKQGTKKPVTQKEKARYIDVQREQIVNSIELALMLTLPIQEAILSRRPINAKTINAFLDIWKSKVRSKVHWRSETSVDLHCRTLGLACVNVLFSHSEDLTLEMARRVVNFVSEGRFAPYQNRSILAHLARKPALHSIAGEFARHISEQIRTDESIVYPLPDRNS